MFTRLRERNTMTHTKMKTCIISLFCLTAAISTIGLAQSTSPHQNTRGALNYAPNFHDFGAHLNNPVLNTSFDVWAGLGCCTLTYWFNWTQPYITVYPLGGTSDGETDMITVTIDTTGLPIGYYPCPIEVNSDQGNGLFWANFSLVMYPEPHLSCTPDVVDFGFVPNGADATMSLAIQNLGTGIVNYTLSEDCSWLLVDPLNGSSNGNINLVEVTAITLGLSPRLYETTITITSNGGNFSIPVKMNLTGIKIDTIKTEIGAVSAVLSNIGNATVNQLHWRIMVEGGLLKLIHRETVGNLGEFGPGEQATLKTMAPVTGFGRITISISADYAKTIVLKGLIFYQLIILTK
jgi:hypothetical protein